MFSYINLFLFLFFNFARVFFFSARIKFCNFQCSVYYYFYKKFKLRYYSLCDVNISENKKCTNSGKLSLVGKGKIAKFYCDIHMTEKDIDYKNYHLYGKYSDFILKKQEQVKNAISELLRRASYAFKYDLETDEGHQFREYELIRFIESNLNSLDTNYKIIYNWLKNKKRPNKKARENKIKKIACHHIEETLEFKNNQ
jgi:hypothetical protein